MIPMVPKQKIKLSALSIDDLLKLEQDIKVEKDERIEILQGRRRVSQDLNNPPAKPTN